MVIFLEDFLGTSTVCILGTDSISRIFSIFESDWICSVSGGEGSLDECNRRFLLHCLCKCRDRLFWLGFAYDWSVGGRKVQSETFSSHYEEEQLECFGSAYGPVFN